MNRFTSSIENLSNSHYELLYERLLVTRAIDNTMCMLQRTGQLLLWPSLHGQEAINVAATVALENIYVFLSYREHGLVFYRSDNFIDYLDIFRGTGFGGSYSNKYDISPCNLLIGDQLLHAVGYAKSYQHMGKRGENQKFVAVFFGDGAMSQGAANEAFLFAETFEIPILFLCVNNQYAISTHFKKQSKTDFYKRASGFGIKSSRVDGNDLIATIDAMQCAVKYIHNKRKPYFLECLTYRISGHTTIDNHLLYRTEEEVERWKKRDPIKLYENFLINRDFSLTRISDRVERKIEDIVLPLENAVKDANSKMSYASLKVKVPLPEKELEQWNRYQNYLNKSKKGRDDKS